MDIKIIQDKFPGIDWRQPTATLIRSNCAEFRRREEGTFIFSSHSLKPNRDGYACLNSEYFVIRNSFEDLLARVDEIISARRTLTIEEWLTEGVKLFGEDRNNWRFKCPVCGHTATIQEYQEVFAGYAAGKACLGNWLPNHRRSDDTGEPGPCDCHYVMGKNPVTVLVPSPTSKVGATEKHFYFEFAS